VRQGRAIATSRRGGRGQVLSINIRGRAADGDWTRSGAANIKS
jgi:hypothetical protein